MKSEWILWKALCHPEPVEKDERMEQIEWKGYYWGYQILMFLIYLNALLIGQFWMDSGPMNSLFSKILLLCAMMLVEGGRFLYCCYHGVQEFAARSIIKQSPGKRGGRTNFLFAGILLGIWGVLTTGFYFGWKHPVPWIIFAVGSIFYWLLCHLAYLHYVLQAEREEPLKGIANGISVICGMGLTLYVGVLLVFGLLAANQYMENRSFPGTDKVLITEEERILWDEIEKGRKRAGELGSSKKEYSYDTDLQEGPDMYEFPNGSVASRIQCWYLADGTSYEQFLGAPGSNQVFWESYWDGKEMYLFFDGMWMPEREYFAKEQPEERMMWNDFRGGPGMELSQVESIVREFRGQESFYTVRYRSGSDIAFYSTKSGDGRQPEQVTEHYALNEFGVLTAYDCEIQGRRADGQTPYVEHSSAVLLSVNREEIEKEVQTLLEQYPKKEPAFI